ncbi:MAG: hypothetical protein AAGG38_13760 [Planctomycetota bacterium]
MGRRRRLALVLGLLAGLFLLRVLGQWRVANGAAGWLPPMDQWYSGLMPYPVLLPIQCAILLWQGWVTADLWRGRGWFARRSRGWGVGLKWFSLVYFVVMLLRYPVVMVLDPGRRWYDGLIPIVFHWVLAGYLYLWSRYLREG